VWAAKEDFIRSTVWWSGVFMTTGIGESRRYPTGMIHALGWEKYTSPDKDNLYVIPETTVGDLASDLKQRLSIRTLRVVGNPNLKVTKIALNPGYRASHPNGTPCSATMWKHW